jgi:hypothetical protein
MDPNHHKYLIAKAEGYYAIARELENEAADLLRTSNFLAKRGDEISEQAIEYAKTGDAPQEGT